MKKNLSLIMVMLILVLFSCDLFNAKPMDGTITVTLTNATAYDNMDIFFIASTLYLFSTASGTIGPITVTAGAASGTFEVLDPTTGVPSGTTKTFSGGSKLMISAMLTDATTGFLYSASKNITVDGDMTVTFQGSDLVQQ